MLESVNFRFDNGNGLSPDASLSVDVTFTGAHTTMIQCVVRARILE